MDKDLLDYRKNLQTIQNSLKMYYGNKISEIKVNHSTLTANIHEGSITKNLSYQLISLFESRKLSIPVSATFLDKNSTIPKGIEDAMIDKILVYCHEDKSIYILDRLKAKAKIDAFPGETPVYASKLEKVELNSIYVGFKYLTNCVEAKIPIVPMLGDETIQKIPDEFKKVFSAMYSLKKTQKIDSYKHDNGEFFLATIIDTTTAEVKELRFTFRDLFFYNKPTVPKNFKTPEPPKAKPFKNKKEIKDTGDDLPF